MNTSLTPHECVNIAQRQVDALILEGACTVCAVRIVANRTGVAPDHLEQLYLDRLLSQILRDDEETSI